MEDRKTKVFPVFFVFTFFMKKPIPFEFVLERLDSLTPLIRPMFGCHALYVDEKIVLILRSKEDHAEDNGLWLATTSEHHESLRADFPAMRSIKLFDSNGPTGWQVLPENDPGFEEMALKACELVLQGDTRIGKVPAAKKKPKRKAAPKKRAKRKR